MEKAHKAKNVTILTGFLGAGKTTFLNHLLKTNSHTRYAIIENEFGKEGIDGDLLVQTSDTIVEMNNGCLCCTLNDNLYDNLSELHNKKDAFDELLIESTGIADPAGIAEPFMVHPGVKREFSLKNVICLVDAELIEEQLKATDEAVKQITFSNIVLITKSDLVHPLEVQALQQKLQSINPLATVLVGSHGSYPAPEMFAAGNFNDFAGTDSAASEKETCHHQERRHQQHGHQHGEIVSLSFQFSAPFNLDNLYLTLNQFLMFQSGGIYRMKGIVYSGQDKLPYIIQAVGKRLSIEPVVRQVNESGKNSRIVFIGKNLKKESFEKMLKKNLIGSKAA